jgi:hypothetical protein
MINWARPRTPTWGEHAFHFVKQLRGFTRCTIAGWPRTWRGRRPCSRCQSSTESGMSCVRLDELNAVNGICKLPVLPATPERSKAESAAAVPLSNL